jgi:hypothetical protein
MTIEQYKQRMADLGLDRGALANGFPEERPSTQAGEKISPYLRPQPADQQPPEKRRPGAGLIHGF